MAEWEKYVSKKIIEAKRLEKSGALWDPRSNQKEPFNAGDYQVRIDGKEHIEAKERFERFHERVSTTPPIDDLGEGY